MFFFLETVLSVSVLLNFKVLSQQPNHYQNVRFYAINQKAKNIFYFFADILFE